MKKKSFLKTMVTLGPIGYLRGGGTYATIATIPLICAYHTLHLSWLSSVLFITIIFYVGLRLIHSALPLFKHHDPSEIVLDEVVGCLVLFAAFSAHTPMTIPVLIAGTTLFRFFDIVKPLGIGYWEKLPGAWGIMLDDVVAAIYAHLALRLIIFLMS